MRCCLTWSPDHTFIVATPQRDTGQPIRGDGNGGSTGGDHRMTERRTPLPGDLSRRRFLQGSALAGTAAFLAACGTAAQSSAAAPPSAAARRIGRRRASASAGAAATPASSGTLRFANWIGYIDADRGRLERSRRSRSSQTETGIAVEYANGGRRRQREFFTSDLQAPLEAGQPTELGPRRPDRLDGGAARPARLARNDRHDPDPELRRQPRRESTRVARSTPTPTWRRHGSRA